MKEYKVFTIFKTNNEVKLEVWLEQQLNIFASEGWVLKEIIPLSFKEDAFGLVVLEKENL